jgi:hypothetical protein
MDTYDEVYRLLGSIVVQSQLVKCFFMSKLVDFLMFRLPSAETLYFLLDSNCAIALSEILVLFGIRIIK